MLKSQTEVMAKAANHTNIEDNSSFWKRLVDE